MISGRKTYTLALAAILAAVAGYLQGVLDVQAALEMAWAGGVAATLRHGLAQAGIR